MCSRFGQLVEIALYILESRYNILSITVKLFYIEIISKRFIYILNSQQFRFTQLLVTTIYCNNKIKIENIYWEKHLSK